MRLLHAESLTFFEVFNNYPPYAILSHTWGEDEVLFDDMLAGRARQKKGFHKIEYCAKQARLDGLEYIWVDTCNIMKTSSAELSEAINSMYRWYKQAQVCYVYLSDVEQNDIAHLYDKESAFRRSRWFTRGWTLQELIAPDKVVFYSREWALIGSKSGVSMIGLLGSITGIDERFLTAVNITEANIAMRMSWARKRVTTRTEDTAYCLLGIFDVNMPLLYGEGMKAFIRLQEELIKQSEDRSIFLWTLPSSSGGHMWTDLSQWSKNQSIGSERRTGMLATSPACFEPIPAEIRSLSVREFALQEFTEPYFATNKGLSISLLIFPLIPIQDIYIAFVCRARTDRYYGILLRCISSIQKTYCRIRADECFSWASDLSSMGTTRLESIYVSTRYPQDTRPVKVSFQWCIQRSASGSTRAPHFVCGWYEIASQPTYFMSEPNHVLGNPSLAPGLTLVSRYHYPDCSVQLHVIKHCTHAGRVLIKVELGTLVHPPRFIEPTGYNNENLDWQFMAPSTLADVNELALYREWHAPKHKIEIRARVISGDHTDFVIELKLRTQPLPKKLARTHPPIPGLKVRDTSGTATSSRRFEIEHVKMGDGDKSTSLTSI